jgi:hypothetical protein
MIRQALGKAALRGISESQEKAKSQFTQNLERVLSLLLPPSPRIDELLHTMVTSIVDIAIPLANSMTEEQSIFRCEWVQCGDDPVEHVVDVVDETQSGKVYLCTFPGFWRVIRDDERVRWVPVRKATAELQNAFA